MTVFQFEFLFQTKNFIQTWSLKTSHNRPSFSSFIITKMQEFELKRPQDELSSVLVPGFPI